jgi:hypothetical protein
MRDSELLRETGSEELTQEDVEEIQQRYNLPTNRDYCFILCDRSKFDWISSDTADIPLGRRQELADSILGDINLFSATVDSFEINVAPGRNKH